MWVFGYGSLIWNPGFAYDARLVGFVRDYRRVFYQGNLTHLQLAQIRAVLGLFAPLISLVFVAEQGARITGARRSSPGGPSRSSTRPGRHAYGLLVSILFFLLCYGTC